MNFPAGWASLCLCGPKKFAPCRPPSTPLGTTHSGRSRRRPTRCESMKGTVVKREIELRNKKGQAVDNGVDNLLTAAPSAPRFREFSTGRHGLKLRKYGDELRNGTGSGGSNPSLSSFNFPILSVFSAIFSQLALIVSRTVHQTRPVKILWIFPFLAVLSRFGARVAATLEFLHIPVKVAAAGGVGILLLVMGACDTYPLICESSVPDAQENSALSDAAPLVDAGPPRADAVAADSAPAPCACWDTRPECPSRAWPPGCMADGGAL